MHNLNLEELMSSFFELEANLEKRQIQFNDPYTLFLRLSANWYKIRTMCDELTYSEVLRIYNQLLQCENLIESIILIGSVSSGNYSKESDIDIVVILRRNKKINELRYVSVFKDINIVYQTKSEFLSHYRSGYEFYVWCVKYGVLLFDKGYFNSLYRYPQGMVNKDEIIHKRTYINSIIIKTYEALTNNDRDLGIKFIKKMVIQSARIILISKDIVARSRGEIGKQLLNTGAEFYELYMILDKLKFMNNYELTEYANKIFQFINNYIEDYYKTK
ncbi:hypothetical protein psyc5s11_30430 [Clostridium gelidum]|uniref:Polymerase beta nucleotidyltransferase domain-containing protein n=1 Tax=Clostridium gelidum TaxID=704125 RepID=A0ABN6IZ97_9CLOT|nr:nucleotidyltransferase domain-containing protein [Clostridium gelidum]BCZ46976.1 hypothetical protein psyc5s11_30430 [Clostridium gelidum]